MTDAISLMNKIHQELHDRLVSHIPTLTLHLNWETSKTLSKYLKGYPRTLYSIRVIIHDPDDLKFTLDWEFR